MDYHTLRAFADSWVLLGMVIFFAIAVAWAWRPSARNTYNDAAEIPLRDATHD